MKQRDMRKNKTQPIPNRKPRNSLHQAQILDRTNTPCNVSGASPSSMDAETLPQELHKLKHISLLCFENGRRLLLDCSEAYRRFWASEFAWLRPLKWYRFDVNEYSGRVYVHNVLRSAEEFMAHHLHRRGRRPLTRDTLQELDPRVTYMTTNMFEARAAKMNTGLFPDLPKELRPFVFTEEVQDKGWLQPAYCLSPKRSVFMICGVAPDNGDTDDDVNWFLFQHPPSMT